MSVETRKALMLAASVFYAVVSVVFVIVMFVFAAPNPEYGNQGTFWFVLVIGLFVIYAVLFPRNWAFVPNKYKGVIFRMGQSGQELHGEGVMHSFWPIESIRRVATYDLKRVRVIKIPVAGVTAQDVLVKYLRIIRFANPILTLQSVPDKDPELESDDLIESQVRKGFQGHTLDTVVAPGGTSMINEAIQPAVAADPTLASWGVDVLRFEILDIQYPKSVRDASDDILRARGKAAAEEIEADGRFSAMNKIGHATYEKLEWYQALQNSNITTLVQFGEVVEDIAKWLMKK